MQGLFVFATSALDDLAGAYRQPRFRFIFRQSVGRLTQLFLSLEHISLPFNYRTDLSDYRRNDPMSFSCSSTTSNSQEMDPPIFDEHQEFDESIFEPLAHKMDSPLSEELEKHNVQLRLSPDPPFHATFASMSLSGVDRVSLLQFRHEDIVALHSVVQSSWHLGIQTVRKFPLSYEFKLNGSPWRGQGSDAIPARILMRSILAYLFSAGWILQAATDVGKKEHDKSTLIFRKQETPPPESEWIAISFNQTNKLRLIGANTQLITAFRSMLKGTRVLQGESWKDKSRNTWEFKIQGTSWVATGEQRTVARMLLLKMVETLERYGWNLYASVNQNEAYMGHSRKTDSWFCVRKKGWDM